MDLHEQTIAEKRLASHPHVQWASLRRAVVVFWLHMGNWGERTCWKSLAKSSGRPRLRNKKRLAGSPAHQPNALVTRALHLFLSPRSLKSVFCQVGLYSNHPSRGYWARPATAPSTVFKEQAKTKIISWLKWHFLNIATYGLYFWKASMPFSPHTNEKFILKGMVPVTSMLICR